MLIRTGIYMEQSDQKSKRGLSSLTRGARRANDESYMVLVTYSIWTDMTFTSRGTCREGIYFTVSLKECSAIPYARKQLRKGELGHNVT